MPTSMPEMTVSVAEHRRFVMDILAAAGCAPSDAELIAGNLLWADLRGRHTNGLIRLSILAKRLVRGLISSPATMSWDVISAAAYRLDAGNGFGQVAGYQAMAKAIELSSDQGVGLVTVRRSNHYGTASYYCAQAAGAGCLGFTFTNAFPKVAPYGGRRAVLGTNPIAFGCPTKRGMPILVDLSTSAISGAEVRSLNVGVGGGRLASGVALDANGNPTDDPAAVSSGCLLPAAGPKGFGLALMVEILSGILAGAAVGHEVGSLFHTWDRPINVGHAFVAVKINSFMSMETFLERLETLLNWISDCPLQNENEPIRFPGEVRGQYAASYLKNGIPIDAGTTEAMNCLAKEFKVKRLLNLRDGS